MQNLDTYVKNGQLSRRETVRNGVVYSLFCYTKDQFYNHPWDEVTITHRGMIYDQTGKRINRPFDKIFNLGEHESTKIDNVLNLLKTEQYEVLDKMNGHLVIVSYDVDRDNLFVTTKGSFKHEMIDNDIAVLAKTKIDMIIKRRKYNITFMFESIVSYDKHSLYDSTIEKYQLDKDSLVLIGAVNNETGKSYNHSYLQSFAYEFGVPVVKIFNNKHISSIKDMTSMLNETGIEGYVIHFPDTGFRFKIKTYDYVKLRYVNDLTIEKIVKEFSKGGMERLYKDYKEELYPIFKALQTDFEIFIFEKLKMSDDSVKFLLDNAGNKAAIFSSEKMNNVQKTYYMGINTIDDFLNSRSLRKEFSKSGCFDKANDRLAVFKR